ncbi:RagB/SusD family nutrient uptake outer membrane protein [Olivibacter domesticus]|uniref:Starch-binding associating with outer membrane n=1 Tax=Olivibacter domesticus TaxID=407022 RepID=A0A1H7QCY1_OLID1|nr:RagB/SusD family nutrient uptake outer membrane protein [Olivibacter domesticus]SEL45736.1 Starch-binding associating with outer membrane [Olivibacter domesticus]
MNRILILLFLIISLSGCKKFLEEDNKGGISNEEFYKTEAGYETLITASYSSLRETFRLTPWLLVAGTDMYQRARGNGDRSIQEYEQLYATDSYVKTYYQNCYKAIQTINMGVFYSDIAEIAADKKSIYLAELRFLRAFYHFLLVEQFGGVYINQQATFEAQLNMPRSSLEDCYAFIISEMEAALPLVGDGRARVNKTVVNHYLAKVYLTRGWDLKQSGDFEKAKSYALAAINGKTISIPFEQLWSPTNENNDEFIFAVQYDLQSIASSTDGNNQQGIFGPYLGGSELNHKYMSAQLYPSWNLHNFYDEKDARYDATFMLTIYDQYFDYYDASKDKTKILIRAYYPRVWGREYTRTDSIAWAAQRQGQIASNFRYYPFKYNEEAYREFYDADMSTPVIKKFDSPSTRTIFQQTASVRDVVLARLAETYFIYAEASIGLNDFATAANYVQAVLDRPGNTKDGTRLSPTMNIAASANQSEALNAYLIESAKEFAGEYLRWPELRRTGKLKEFCGRYNYDIKKIGVDQAFRGLDGRDKILRPIPQDAIDLNEAEIQQNPGYQAQ